jgi:hypothetical protein
MEKAKEYSHCLICRRRLKNPQARRIGIGAKCKKKHEAKPKEKVTQIEMF